MSSLSPTSLVPGSLQVTFGICGTGARHSFRSPEPQCVLRIHVDDGDAADRVETFLAAASARRLVVRSRALTEGILFELAGSHRDLADFLEVFGACRDGPGDETLKGRLVELSQRALDSWAASRFVLDLPRGRRWELGGAPRVLGILNVTPDSFSDGGRFTSVDAARSHAEALIAAGADAIDIGGESTRPGAAPVPLEEELERVLPVLRAVRASSDVPISIDTSKAEVARRALEEGADIINDVTALEGDPRMADVLRGSPAPIVIMHMRGTPRNMQDDPRYVDPTAEVLSYLGRRIEAIEACGIARQRLVVDPGIGFGKRALDNLSILGNINAFRSLGRPVLLGVSRKSFLGKILGASVEHREAGTAIANTLAALDGVHVLRVHDAGAAAAIGKLLRALQES